MSTNARLNSVSISFGSFAGAFADSLDTQAVGNITYPVENRAKRSLCRIVVCFESGQHQHTSSQRKAKEMEAKDIPIRIPSTTTTAQSISYYKHGWYSVCQELSASRIKTTTTRRGWGYAAAWLGRDKTKGPDDVERTRLLACAEMAVGCGEDSPARDSHSVY